MKKFFKIFFITMGVLATLFLILMIVAVSVLSRYIADKPVSLTDNQVLKITLNKSIPEMPVEELDRMLKVSDYSFYDLLRAVKLAEAHEKIQGVFIKIEAPSLGWAQTQELVSALKSLREKGKKVWVYYDFVTDKEYVLASVADQIYCAPQAITLFDGLNANMVFFKGMLKKVGIEFETIRHGKFKSAVEPFVNDDISPENRMMMSEFLTSLTDQYLAAIQENRQFENVRQLMDEGPYLITGDALAKQLVDSCVIGEEIYKAAGFSKKDCIGVVQFLKAAGASHGKGQKIALVTAEGEISSGKSKRNILGDATLIENLKKAFEAENVASIVLRINSPGGSGGASDNVWQFIEEHKAEKPVVVSFGNIAASGGYYIAMNSHKIIAEPTTLTGSIGVFFLRPVVRGLFNKLDLKTVSIKSAPNAGFLASPDAMNDYEEMKVTQMIENFYDQFITKVATGRNKSKEAIDSIGQGRIWTGSQALDIGLIDQYGGLMVALREAANLGGIDKTEELNVWVLPEARDIITQIMDEDFFSSVKIISSWMELDESINRGEVMMRLPYEVSIE